MSIPNANMNSNKLTWFQLLVLTPLARLRFILILGAIGLALAKWETLIALGQKWSWSRQGTDVAGEGFEYFCPMHP
ncbi:hypothetical protein EBS67_11150, partial [bacterium]|nr:hypothetical protein [bacterium]